MVCHQVTPSAREVNASIAQGGSQVAYWIDGGLHSHRLPDLIAELNRQGLEVDAAVWHQGETEAWRGDNATGYASQLSAWIANVRRLGIMSPIYIYETTRDGQGVLNAAILEAQACVWSARSEVYAGADTDGLGSAFRSDSVHFNRRGQENFAAPMQRAMDHSSDLNALTLADLNLP